MAESSPSKESLENAQTLIVAVLDDCHVGQNILSLPTGLTYAQSRPAVATDYRALAFKPEKFYDPMVERLAFYIDNLKAGKLPQGSSNAEIASRFERDTMTACLSKAFPVIEGGFATHKICIRAEMLGRGQITMEEITSKLAGVGR